MVTTSELQHVVALAGTLCLGAPRARWYLFGSARTNIADAEDIDILVVHGDSDDVSDVRRQIQLLRIVPPIDLYIMTEEEEAELGFVDGQGAVRLFP